MNLFSEKNNIFLKIMNGIFLIWLITSLIVLLANIINIVMPEPLKSYNEYKTTNCYYSDKNSNEEESEEWCQRQYEGYKDRRYEVYNNKKNSMIALGNILIIGATMVFLNKKKED